MTKNANKNVRGMMVSLLRNGTLFNSRNKAIDGLKKQQIQIIKMEQ